MPLFVQKLLTEVSQIRELLNNLYASTKRITAAQMRKELGFPENWEAVKDTPLVG